MCSPPNPRAIRSVAPGRRGEEGQGPEQHEAGAHDGNDANREGAPGDHPVP